MMKKIISLLMAFVFVFTMAAPTFAAVAANDVAPQASVTNDDESSGANDFLGQAIDILNSIWRRIVDFFRSLFGFGFKPGSYTVTYYTDDTKTEVLYKVPVVEGDEIPDVAVPTRTGFTFKSWVPALPLVMPAEDIEVYATWSVKTVTIKFVTGIAGVKVPDIVTTYGSLVTLPEPIGADEYILECWYYPNGVAVDMPNGQIVANDNYVMTAGWSQKRSTITFNPCGGYWYENPANIGNITIEQLAGEPVVAPADPSKDGYKFEGWDGVVPTKQPAEDVEFKAVWSPLDITTTWVSYDKVLDTQTTKCGSDLSPKVAAVPAAGYRFVGWESSTDGIVYYGFPISTPTRNTTFTAAFEPNEYSYTFLNENGSTIKSGKALCDSEVAVNPLSDKTGYTFVGWEDKNGNIVIGSTATSVTMTAGDVIYKASYKANVHNVTWDAVGGTFADGKTEMVNEVAYDTTVSKPEKNPEMPGYVFNGWKGYTNGMKMPDSDLTFTAVWGFATDTKYTVETYKMGTDGVYVKSTETFYGTTGAPVTADTSAIEGFTFNASKSLVSGSIAADGSLILKVYYDRNKYDLYTKADAEAEPVKVKSYYYDEAITYPADPAKEGNTFAGWANKPEGDKMPASDVTLIATWNVNSYTITYKTASDDANPIVVTYKYGSKIMTLGAPANEGYYFEGWKDESGNDLPEIMPAYNIVAVANFTKVVTCTVTYKANGGKFEGTGNTVTETLSVDYGSKTPVPDKDPVKDGFKFVGWYEETDTEKANLITSAELKENVVKGNLTYVAEYVEIFNLTFDAVEGYWLKGEAQEHSKILEVGLGEVPEIEDPTAPEGKVFVGWAVKPAEAFEDTAAAVAAIEPLKAVEKDSAKEFVAVYLADKFVINYMHDGEIILLKAAEGKNPAEYLTQTLKYGETVTAYGRADIPEAVIDSKKFDFEGWTPEVPEVINFETLADLTVAYGEEENVIEFTSVTKAREYNIMYVGAEKAAIAVDFGAAFPEAAKDAPAAREGYTFNGWLAKKDADEKTKAAAELYYVFPVTMPASNVVLYPDWSINAYTLTLDFGDGRLPGTTETSKTYVLDYATPLAAYLPAADPECTGMVFGGWKWTNAAGEEIDALTTMPDEDIKVTALWTFGEYTVTYKANGGSIGGKNQVDQAYNYKDVITPPAATRTGWTFAGWSVSPAESGITSIVEGTIMPPCDVVATAQWIQNNYTLKYLNDDGSVYREEKEMHYGDVIVLPEDPTKEGHTFTGWEGYTDGMTMPNGNLEFKATYSVNEYTITYVNKGLPEEWLAEYGTNFEVYEVGNVICEQIVDYGVTIDPVINQDRFAPGYKVTATDGYPADMKMPAANFTVVVNWGIDAYDVTFDADGGKMYVLNEEDTFDQVETVTLTDIPYTTKLYTRFNPGAPTKAGYTFAYWYRLDAEGNEVKVTFAPGSDTETMPNADTTYYAKYTPKQYNVTFAVVHPDATVTYKVYEGVDCGSVIVFPESPVYNKGDDFEGYQMPVDENGKPVWVDGANQPVAEGVKVPAYNVTFYAILVPITYTVTFSAGEGKFSDGKTVKYVDAEYDGFITAPEDPTREGYKFNGWSPAVYKLDQADNGKIFTATWTVDGNKIYKIITEIEGQETKTEIKNDGVVGKEVFADVVDIEGYELDAAKSVLKGTIPATGTLELKLVYVKKTYTVKKSVEGVETVIGTYKYNDILAEPANPDLTETPSKEFLGWYTNAACTEKFIAGSTVTSDVTLYAKIQTKRFTVEIASVTGIENPYADGVDYGTKIDVSKLAAAGVKEWLIMTESGETYDPSKGATENIILMPVFA